MSSSEEFLQIQRALLEHAREQTRLQEQQATHIKRIGDKVEFLGWMIVVIVLLVVSISSYHR